MKRWPRILALTIAGVIALVLIAVALVALFFPADRARSIAVAQLQARLHEPVVIEDAHVRVIPLRVSLKGIRIGGAVPTPNQPVIAVRSLDVGMRLLPLLRRQIDVSGIDIDRPSIQMILSKEAPPPTPQRTATPVGQPMSLRVQHLGIHNGTATVLLADGSPFIHVGGLSEDLSAGVSTGGAVDVTGELGIDTLHVNMAGAAIGQGLKVRLEHDLHYEQGQDILSLRKGVLHLGGIPIAVAGQVAGLKKPEPSLDITLHGGPAEIKEIVGLIPVKLMPAAAGEIQSSGTLRVDGAIRGSGKTADFTVDLLLENGRIAASRMLPQPIEGIRLALHARPDTIDVREFAARSAGTSVRGRVTLVDYQRDPRFRLAADAGLDLGAVSGLLVPPDSMRLGGAVSARVVAEGRSRDPQNASIDGLLRFTSVSAQGKALPQPVTNGNGEILLQGQSVSLRGLSLKVGSSDLALNGSLSNPLALMPPPKTGAGAGAGAAPVMPIPSGRARFDLALKSGLLDLNPFLAGPQKKMTIVLPPGDGTISLSCGRLLVQKLEARNVNGRLVLDHGVVHLDGLGMQALGGTVAMNGTVDMSAMEKGAARKEASRTGAARKGTAVASAAGPKIDVTAQAKDIAITDLFALAPALDRFGRLRGFLNGGLSTQASLRGMLNDSLALDLPTLMSNGNLEITNAKLTDLPVQKAISGFLNLPQLNNATVQEWKQAFRIENGRLNIDGLDIRAGDVELNASGWQAIDGTMEMKFDLMLPRQFSQAVASKLPADAAAVLMTGTDPRMYVPLKLSGKTASPTVSLDAGQISAAAKAAAEARLAQEKARLADEAKRQAQQIIQRNVKLPGLPGLPADTTKHGSPLDSLKIKNDVLKKLGNIFGK